MNRHNQLYFLKLDLCFMQCTQACVDVEKATIILSSGTFSKVHVGQVEITLFVNLDWRSHASSETSSIWSVSTLMFWERRAVCSMLSCFKLTCKSTVSIHTRSNVRNNGNNGPVKQVPQKSVYAGD